MFGAAVGVADLDLQLKLPESVHEETANATVLGRTHRMRSVVADELAELDQCALRRECLRRSIRRERPGNAVPLHEHIEQDEADDDAEQRLP